MKRAAVSSRTAAGTVRAALAEVAKALGHEHRVELIEQLAQGPRSVEPLAQRVGLTVANASQHLQQLRRAGLVTAQREGKRVVYRLADDAELAIVALLGGLRRVAEHSIASMERVIGAYFRARDALEPVAASELGESSLEMHFHIGAFDEERRLNQRDTYFRKSGSRGYTLPMFLKAHPF